MSYLFQNATTFNKSISSWDTSSVYTMDYMFAGANAFNQDVSSFDTSNVLTMESMFSMEGSSNPQFNNANLSGIGLWNTSKVTNMNKMFFNARLFNQNLTAWVVSQVTQKTGIFYSTPSMLVVNYPQFSPPYLYGSN